LCGALLVALADLVGRATFAPIQIPAGLITAIIGVPVFIYLLQRATAKSHL
jgi:iron complex transport system permease protein